MRKTSIRRDRVFQVVLKDVEKINFSWENFVHSILLSCRRQQSVNID